MSLSTTTRAKRRAPMGAALASAALTLSLLAAQQEAAAIPKEACLDAHGRGQDLREKGQLTRARQMFMTCAQSSCPSLVQGDCARFVEEVDRMVPSVSFGARDEKGTDLAATSVYVDDQLIATRLDDGKSYEFDPGRHSVRFVHQDKETTLTLVLNQGEKARTVVAAFNDPRHADGHDASSSAPAVPAPPTPHRPAFPLVVAGAGAAALVAGGVIIGLGIAKVPSNCSYSSKDCAAIPGDPSFSQAHDGASLANLGIGVGIGGAVVLVGGLVWYFTRTPVLPTKETGAARVLPWIGPGTGGVSFSKGF